MLVPGCAAPGVNICQHRPVLLQGQALPGGLACAALLPGIFRVCTCSGALVQFVTGGAAPWPEIVRMCTYLRSNFLVLGAAVLRWESITVTQSQTS